MDTGDQVIFNMNGFEGVRRGGGEPVSTAEVGARMKKTHEG